MRIGRTFAVVASGAMLVQTQAANAQAPYPSKAVVYQTQFARAMDECVGPGVTIVNPGSVDGCTQVNSVTDNAITAIQRANLKVSRRSADKGAYIRFVGKGFAPVGSDIGLQLTLRTTNKRGLPAATSKTYEDQSIICGDLSGGLCGNFSDVDSKGKVVIRQSLNTCLTANGLSNFIGSGNIEILDAALINCSNGKVVARPGILQEPLQ